MSGDIKELGFLHKPESCYRSILLEILEKGVLKSNRMGIDTKSIFNTSWNSGKLLTEGYFPLITMRKIFFKGALVELFWILGILQTQNPIPNIDRNNVIYLKNENVHYWDKWADEKGDLGPVYGKQLMEWDCGYFNTTENDTLERATVNQIQNIIDTLRTNPDDRRLVFSMWNPGELNDMALPPCHWGGEFYSEPLENGKRCLHLRWIQRSCDMPIGIPFDICLYSLLLFMMSKMTNHEVGTVYGLFGDSHIYVNQIEGVKEMLSSAINVPPNLIYSGPDYVEKLEDFQLDWFSIENYKPAKIINMPVAV